MSSKSILHTISFLALIKYYFSFLDYTYTHTEGETLKIGIGQLKSVITHLPFKPSYPGLFQLKGNKKINDNLAEIISGNKITESNFEVILNKNEYCKKLNTVFLNLKNSERTKWLINHEYSNSFFLDKLPSARGYYDNLSKEYYTIYQGGIPLGYTEEDNNGLEIYHIYNHFTFKILIHEKSDKKYEIVGFITYPSSITQNEEELGCNKYEANNINKNDSYNIIIPNYEYSNKAQVIEPNINITFTYDIIFEKSNLTLVSRWDNYLHLSSDIHWFGLLNSNLIILIFTFVIIFIFCRSIKHDIDLYNIRVTNDDFIDEYGWKQVCNDVFRKPKNSIFLSTFIGNGVQLFSMVFFSLLISIVGVLKPESRNNLLTLMILMFILMGILGGYSSSVIYKSFHGTNWLKNALLTALLYPSIIYCVLIFVNFFLIFEDSDSINFTSFLSLLFLWLFCSTPLVLIGAFFGTKKKRIKIPCRINPCPTTIPSKPWYFRIKYLIWVTGLIPFAAIFIEFIYLMASLWREHIYYLFGFLWITLNVMIIISSEVSIIVVYLCLCKGDYNWWWKSFFIGGSPVIYIMGYSIYYFFYLNITRFSTMIIYFCAMGFFSSGIFLICGGLSTVITYAFLIKIYSMIKID